LTMFYAYPMRMYFTMAVPLDELSPSDIDIVYKDDDDIEKIRYYFGLGFNY